MTLSSTRSLCVLAASLTAAYGVSASTSYDESISGDLSDDPNAPTVLVFGVGSNTVAGEVNLSNDTTSGDRDFITFTIGAGEQLTGLFLTAQSPNDRGFHAISSGPTSVIPSGPGAGDVSTYLGSAHLDFISPGTDLLPDLGTPLVGSGFTGPLGPGTYSYVIQQTGNITQAYTLDFVVAPEPGSMALLAAPALLMLRRRRR